MTVYYFELNGTKFQLSDLELLVLRSIRENAELVTSKVAWINNIPLSGTFGFLKTLRKKKLINSILKEVKECIDNNKLYYHSITDDGIKVLNKIGY